MSCSKVAGEPLHRLNILAYKIEVLLGIFELSNTWIKLMPLRKLGGNVNGMWDINIR